MYKRTVITYACDRCGKEWEVESDNLAFNPRTSSFCPECAEEKMAMTSIVDAAYAEWLKNKRVRLVACED